MGVVLMFRIEMPEDARDTMEAGSVMSAECRGWIGVACLADEQTVVLELGFLWAMPLAIILFAILSLPSSQILSLCLKDRMPEASFFGFQTVLFMCFGLYFTTGTQSGLFPRSAAPLPDLSAPAEPSRQQPTLQSRANAHCYAALFLISLTSYSGSADPCISS